MKERGCFQELSVGRRTILKLILKEWDGRDLTELICLRTAKSGGFFENGNELSVSIKCGKFIHEMKT